MQAGCCHRFGKEVVFEAVFRLSYLTESVCLCVQRDFEVQAVEVARRRFGAEVSSASVRSVASV
jgi:hypothetical protein